VTYLSIPQGLKFRKPQKYRRSRFYTLERLICL